LGLTSTHSVNHFHSANFIGIDTLPVKIQLAPKEEELLAHLVGHVAINYGISLIVLMDHIEGLTIPDPQKESLSINYIVSKDAVQFANFSL